jgi:histidine triad (HIT) family protein
MAECLFCGIVAGKVPTALVYESPAGVAFLDRLPAARGHTLVVPRVHAENLLELPDEAIGDFFRVVKAVTGKIAAALHPIAFHVGWNHGQAAGQAVFHLHVHVIPRFTPGRGIQSLGAGGERGDLAEIAAAIRGA